MRDVLEYLREETERALKSLGFPETEAHFEKPRDPSHGDIASNIALPLARLTHKPPFEIARLIADGLSLDEKVIAAQTVAHPGFINFVLSPDYLREVARWILEKGADYANLQTLASEKILLEFVSANPTGPLNVVSARAAAVGDSLRRILETQGASVHSEYYVNDSGNQVRLLGETVWEHFKKISENPNVSPVPGYYGMFPIEVAKRIYKQNPNIYVKILRGEESESLGQSAVDSSVQQHRNTLEKFRVPFTRWFRESELRKQGAPQEVLEQMIKAGAVFQKDGATYLRTPAFGDTQDWVVQTSDGRWTYFLPDIAYHINKFARGYTELIDILGPDHHTFPAKMGAAMRIMELPADRLHVIILQQVNLLRNGVVVKMSKRAGEIIEMEELIDEVGVDAARYFFVLRRTSTPLDFDIELAKSQSEENPVYYVQYAHARIASIFRKGQVTAPDASVNLEPLENIEELNLLRRLRELPEVIAEAARIKDPHGLTTWLREVATQFHRFYHHCRVLGETKDLEAARLGLCRATQIALARGLDLLGVSAPETM